VLGDGSAILHLDKAVIPAQAGIHASRGWDADEWIPAFAGIVA
jgi:hypothetical protein